MSYSKTTWLEHGHTTAQKLTALDNLEGMYSQACSYIDAITHSERYYTEAEAAARYFTSANDGAGSGLIAATLDDYTSDQIIAAGSPSGVIAWWSGSEASIPSGWLLCNGLNGTPDLRDRFVVGAGSHYSKGDTGGANTVTTTATITVAGHALTAGEIAKHTHTYTDYYSGNRNSKWGTWGAGLVGAGLQSTVTGLSTGSTGSGDAHSHTASFTGTSGQTKMPQYYAACYIQKA